MRTLPSRSVQLMLLHVGLLLTPIGPAVAADGFTPEHLAKLRFVASAKISPDGRSIAYVLSVPRVPFKDDNGPAWSELHLISADGVSRPFITGKADVSAVAWTPDGSGISFMAKRQGDEQKAIYVIPVDGGEARKVLSFETDIESYTWSPDGQRVAFIAKEKKPKDKKELEDKGFNQEAYEEDFRPVRLWIAEPDNKDAKPEPMDLPGYPADPVWSPVGSHLAMTLAPTPFIDDNYMRRKLHVFDADDGSIVSSFQNPGKLGDTAWSPDGKKVAIISGEDINDPAEGRLMIARTSDGTLRDILPDYLGHVGSIEWQDNDTVMFLGEEGVWMTFKEIGADGSEQKTHIPTGKIVARSLSLSRDGQAGCMIVESPQHPGEVYAMRHGDAGPRRLTHSNPWLDKVRLAEQEVIRYKARDGLDVEGLLIHPLDEKPGQRYPLIVTVHGGPEAHYSNGWLTRYADPGQIGAAAGFAVFYPNYRGSTGRGVAYTKAHQADYAGKEFDDLIDGIDHLAESGLIDPKKVGVTGGSYGGFATAWCSTYYSDRFAAGVMFVGISDLVSKTGSTDIPHEMMLVHARKWLWEDWDFFVNRSPIRYLDRAKTPLLIMHGKDDTRVHPSQSLELYRHLKVLNQVPVRLVWYPGEGHGNRKTASRFDYNLRMRQWFEHYLKGPGGPPPPFELDYGPLAEETDRKDQESKDATDEKGASGS